MYGKRMFSCGVRATYRSVQFFLPMAQDLQALDFFFFGFCQDSVRYRTDSWAYWLVLAIDASICASNTVGDNGHLKYVKKVTESVKKGPYVGGGGGGGGGEVGEVVVRKKEKLGGWRSL